METINIKEFDEQRIVLKSGKDIEKILNLIDKQDSFIISWSQDNKKSSRLIVPETMGSKIKIGDISILAEED